MKKLLLYFLCHFFFLSLSAQRLTLEQVYQMARENYPLLKQKDLIRKSDGLLVQNIIAGGFPQLSINGQATYQSEVTEIPIKLPNQNIPQLNKDQYRVYAEALQPLTDLFTLKIQKELQEITSQNATDNLEAELYKIKERITTIYFNILLIEEQRKQDALTKKDIENGIKKVNAFIQNGTDFRSSADKLRAEALKIDQRDIELRSNRKAYLDILGIFIGQTLSETTLLQLPHPEAGHNIINRPELNAFSSQQKIFETQARLLNTKTLPKFSIFLQGGVGRPALNMLNNDFRFYYLGGLRLNWSISNYYTNKREKNLLQINKEMVAVQKDRFLFETNLLLRQALAEVKKLQDLLDTDHKILALQTSVKNAADAQLENGVITVNDYLREVHSEESTRQQAIFHHIQLLQARQVLKTIAGN